MQFNLFDWIRAGVRQAVLLGVSDAAEHIGTREQVDELNQNLLVALRQDTAAAIAGPRSDKKSGRKPLGRSLKQIMDEQEG